MPAGKFPRVQIEAQARRLHASIDAAREQEAQNKRDVETVAKFLIQTLNDTGWPDGDPHRVVDAFHAFKRLHPGGLIQTRAAMARNGERLGSQ